MPMVLLAAIAIWCSLGAVVAAFSTVRQGGRRNGAGAPQQESHGKPSVPRPMIDPSTSFSYTSAFHDGIEILPAPNGKGLGAFLTTNVAQGSILGEYSGEILTRKEVEARYWKTRRESKEDRKWRNSRKRRNQGISGDYLFDVGDDSFIDGEDADCSSWCRFANHAPPNDGTAACNVEVIWRAEEASVNTDLKEIVDAHHLYFVALVAIEAGTELCYDYGEEYWDSD